MIQYFSFNNKQIFEHLDELHDFYKQFYKKDYSDALSNSLFVLCANDNNKVIGSLRIVGDLSRFVFIVDLWVDMKYQKLGIATNLISNALNICRASNPDHVYLVADKSNQWLINFYEKTGFSEINGSILMEFNKQFWG